MAIFLLFAKLQATNDIFYLGLFLVIRIELGVGGVRGIMSVIKFQLQVSVFQSHACDFVCKPGVFISYIFNNNFLLAVF